ncbi:hypothetical protein [Nocardiopsis prasina]|uniref:hypothetical protein n=1 Tax=Nocardiopsis prasina TaxID=2015 RepID=UPI0003454E19|nr:hypothetical protein [Nocardiopsis prasina]
MATLRIRLRDVTPDQHSALIQLLRDSLIRQDQITVESTGNPSGPMLWTTLVLLAGTIAMLLAWIWGGEWRWGVTAIIPALISVVTFGMSVSRDGS